MSKLLAFVGATAGGYLGWALGTPLGLFGSFVLSIIGTGAGVYAGRRVGRHYES